MASVRPIVMGAVLRNVTFTEGKGQTVLLHVQALYMKQKLTLVNSVIAARAASAATCGSTAEAKNATVVMTGLPDCENGIGIKS